MVEILVIKVLMIPENNKTKNAKIEPSNQKGYKKYIFNWFCIAIYFFKFFTWIFFRFCIIFWRLRWTYFQWKTVLIKSLIIESYHKILLFHVFYIHLYKRIHFFFDQVFCYFSFISFFSCGTHHFTSIRKIYTTSCVKGWVLNFYRNLTHLTHPNLMLNSEPKI